MENIFFILFKKECAHMHFTQMSKIIFYIIIIKSDKFLNQRNRSRILKVRILDSQKSSLANRLSYFQNISLIHVNSRPAPRLSIELQQSNIYTYTYIYDRPRDTYPSSYSSLTVGMIGPDTHCLELQQSYHSLSTYLNNNFHNITHINSYSSTTSIQPTVAQQI